jgi:hypothetical protein
MAIAGFARGIIGRVVVVLINLAQGHAGRENLSRQGVPVVLVLVLVVLRIPQYFLLVQGGGVSI